jgi:hypothetical protein
VPIATDCQLSDPLAIRCTYCRLTKPADAFAQQGDHVVPAVLGGVWVDPQACDACNARANQVADELIARDPLVAFLRCAYDIRGRYGAAPPPCRFSVDVPEGGVVHVTLHEHESSFELAMPPSVAESLGLQDASNERLRRLVAELLHLDGEATFDSLVAAQAAQQHARNPTPPHAWSRFMAKLALACGRDAYGETWLDSRQAAILSEDLLGDGEPRYGQRTHYPPVQRIWPYEPPKHELWIERHEDIDMLTVVLFGQVIGALPVHDSHADTDPSAWSLDPQARVLRRANHHGKLAGTAAARLTQAGHDVVTVMLPEGPMIFVPDGADGPAELPFPTIRADSPSHALQLVLAARADGADV